MDRQAKILLIDDDISIINALKRVLKNKGYEIFDTTDPNDAMDIIGSEDLDLIICDQQLPGSSGIDILKYSIKTVPDAIRILITGYVDVNVAIAAINEGSIFRYISKPWKNEELLGIVAEAIQKKKESDMRRNYKMLSDILEPPLINRVKRPSTEKIPIWNNNEEIVLMKPSEVYFFTAVNGEVMIYTQSGKFKSSETLNYWEKKLEDMSFFRCHRSFLVNVDKIEKISPWFNGAMNLKLKDVKDSIPVSRSATKGLREYVDF